MTQGDSPFRPPSSSLEMDIDDEGYNGEDTFEIIYSSDLEDAVEDEEPAEEDEDSDDNYDDLRFGCNPSTDHASLIFKQHIVETPGGGGVFCLGVNPADDTQVISGGQDEKMRIWCRTTGEVIFETSYFHDSVIEAAFSFSGKYFAGIDMGGNIGVWKNAAPEYTVAFEQKLEGDIQWMRWHSKANVLLVGEVSGSIYMWKIPSGDCRVFGGENLRLNEVGAFMPDGKRAVACYTDGTIRIHNLGSTPVTTAIVKYEPSETNKAHFISLDVHPDNNLVALGTLSCQLLIVKTKGSKSVTNIDCTSGEEREQAGRPPSVEDVKFSRNLPYTLVVAASDNGLHVIDYVRSEKRGYIPIEEGVTRIIWPEGSHLVYVGTKLGYIAVCDVRALKRHMTLEGHPTSILAMTMTMDHRTLITASDDGAIRVFNLEELFAKEDFNPFPVST